MATYVSRFIMEEKEKSNEKSSAFKNLPSTSADTKYSIKMRETQNSLPVISKNISDENVQKTMKFLNDLFGAKPRDKNVIKIEKDNKSKKKRMAKTARTFEEECKKDIAKSKNNRTKSCMENPQNGEKIKNFKEKNEKLRFEKFLRILNHKTLKGNEVENVEIVKIQDKNEEFSSKQLKTVQFQREVTCLGINARIYWQIEKDIKYMPEIKETVLDKVYSIPTEELIKNDERNQALNDFNLEVEKTDKNYTQGLIEQERKVLNQRLFKNQKQNWILDIDPYLEDQEPWKTMEKEGQFFSLKFVPETVSNVDLTKLDEKSAVIESCEVVDRNVEKKFFNMTQEENLFQELLDEAQKNYNELSKTSLLSRPVKSCCKVYKKNHRCKKLQQKHKSTILQEKNEPENILKNDNVEISNPSLELYNKLIDLKNEHKHPENSHPFFGDKFVYAKQFANNINKSFSKHHLFATKQLKKREKNFNTQIKKESVKEFPITIFPIKKFSKSEPIIRNPLTKEQLLELKWKVEVEPERSSEEEEEDDLRFISFQSLNNTNT